MIFDCKSHFTTAELLEQAIQALSRSDPRMEALIRHVGPCKLGMRRRRRYFPSLVEAIIYQQLSGKAAASILAKFRSLYPNGRFPTPEEVASTSNQDLRSAGLSAQKISYLKDLARCVIEGAVPLRRLSGLTDVEIIAHLTQVKGIGRWTAEMFLIFTLGRPDVLPVGDLGIRKAFQRLYGYKVLPAPRTLHRLGRRWQPYRSVASWYLWASVDGGAPLPPVK